MFATCPFLIPCILPHCSQKAKSTLLSPSPVIFFHLSHNQSLISSLFQRTPKISRKPSPLGTKRIMSFFSDLGHTPAATKPPDSSSASPPSCGADPRVPLMNLSLIQARMDSLQKFLTESVNSNTLLGQPQMDRVSSEIASAIQQIIVNGTALLSSNPEPNPNPNPINLVLEMSSPKVENEIPVDDEFNDDEIIELDAVELLAEHVHFCDICGKGFKRDANLRMHMRAHGNQFKTREALAKPGKGVNLVCRRIRFSCPYAGCNRNKQHRKFRPLKSAICLKNHFKRSHCPKMYTCTRCNNKSFSVVADLKGHFKHCGGSRWKCSCGTSFSRKDKLFGHMALFEGHMPAVMDNEGEEEKGNGGAPAEDNVGVGTTDRGFESPNVFFDGLIDEFGPIQNYCFQDLVNSPSSMNSLGSGMEEFFNF